MDNKTEVTTMLLTMGFQPEVVEKAYTQASIKTVEGVINYIEATPSLNSAMQVESQEQPAQEQGGDSGKMEEENAQTEEQKPAENLIPISSHVNAQLRDNLIAMGFEKNPVEKALFMTQNKSMEAALEWIEQNKDAPDFKEPLFIVGNQGGGATGLPKKSNLTPEEAKAKARELQKVLAEKRKQKDKELEEEREKNRLRTGKELIEAKRQLEEHQRDRHVKYVLKEKEEKQKAMNEILAKIEQDRIARGGKVKPKKPKPAKEVMSEIIKKMQRIYPAGSMSGGLVKKCIKTCGIYLSKNTH